MLDRPPSRTARRRAQQRGWQRDWRRRVRDGSKLTEVPGSMIDFLLAAQWLKPDEAEDKRAITDALDCFARDARKRIRLASTPDPAGPWHAAA